MVEYIISLLLESDLDYKHIKAKTAIEDILLEKTLNNMQKEGLILLNNKKYTLVSKTNFKKGIVKITSDNKTIVKTDSDEDIIINSSSEVNDGDIVLANVNPMYREFDTKYGSIFKILERHSEPIVGEVIIKNNIHYVKYKNNLIPLTGTDLSNVTSGYLILAKKQDNCANLLKVIGHKEKIDMAVEPYVYKYGFEPEFPKEVIEEVKKIPLFLTEDKIQELITKENFVDLRNVRKFTIDGEDAKDLDDGVSIKKNNDGSYTIITSVTIPGYYIKRDSYTYQDVIKRGNSAYFDGSVVSMLHPRMSNEICSLNEKSDRLGLSYFVTIDNDGKIINVDVKKSIINSKKRMTYKEVNDFLENNIIPNGYEEFLNDLNLMNGLAKKIDRIFKQRGYLDFYSPEIKIKREDGKIKFEKRVQKSGEKLIEKFMVLPNMEVTKYLTNLGLKLMYRVHEKPNQQKLVSVMALINSKYPFKLKEHYSNKDIQKVLKLIHGTKEEKIFSSYLIRCQSRAKFSSKNIGHYGLAADQYAMLTAGIRRGEDFIDQSIILDYLDYGVEYANNLWADDLEQLAKHFTERELAADKLERAVLKNRLAEELKNHIGEIHKGIISGVNEYGVFVEINEMYEGFVRKELLGKKMKYSQDIYSLISKETYDKFSVGDEIEIEIARVNADFSVDFNYIGRDINYNKQETKIRKRIL